MRLMFSLLAATGVHGALIGVAAAVLTGGAPTDRGAFSPPPSPIDVDIMAAEPDPVAVSGPAAAAPTRSKRPGPAIARRPSGRRPRVVALADRAASAEPAIAPAVAASPPTMFSAPSAADALPSSSAPSPSPAAFRPELKSGGSGTLRSAQPRYLTNSPPEYPIASQRRREQGVVLLNVVVERDGTPSGVSLNRSSGYPLLDRAARDAVRRWIFDPARLGGQPVSSVVVVPVRFALADRT